MASELQRVAQGLIDVLDEMPRVVAYLLRTAQKCREHAAYVGGLTNHPAARQAAIQLDEAAKRCDEAAHYAAIAPQWARAWVQQMVSGSRTAEPSGTVPSRPDSSAGRTPPAGKPPVPEGAKGFDPQPFLSKLPERVVTRGYSPKTRGIWIDDNGDEHDLVSGRHDPECGDAQRHAERLNRVRYPHKLSTAADVELKFAMHMRREGIRKARIVLNNEPCLGELGCDELLPEFLPPGSELTIYAPNNFKQTYYGKPEAV